jgi:hypothetical protein
MNNFGGSPEIANQRRYLTVALTCSGVPVVVVTLLPEPLRSAMMPIVAVFGAYAFLYGLALLLLGLEWLWKILRKPSNAIISCPACHTREDVYRRFFVSRVTPHIMRIHCPECHERWMERR